MSVSSQFDSVYRPYIYYP